MAAIPRSSDEHVRSSRAPSIRLRPLQLVVADAREVLREAVRGAFEDVADIEVAGEASTIEELLQLTSQEVPDVAIVNSELFECAAPPLEQLTGRTSVIILAASKSPDGRDEALRAGARAFLSIGCTFDDLMDAVIAVGNGMTVVPRPRRVWVVEDLRAREAGRVDEQERLSRLTRRERDVLALLGEGKNAKAIADRLFISHQTARTHVKRVLDKLEVHSSVEAVAFAHQVSVESSDARGGR